MPKKIRKHNKRIKKTRGEPNPLEQAFLSSVPRRALSNLSLGYETEKLPYFLEKYYLPDFVFTFKDGRKMYVETKGWFRSEDRAKMLAVKQANPDLDIRMVFPKDGLLYKGSKSRYSDWCRKHNFPYHLGTQCPKNWLE